MKAPAFQMYAADIYMDTNEWSAEAFGIYNRLLNHQWVNGSIPADMKTLAQISFVSIKKMSKSWPEMVSKFEYDDTHRGRNKRLEETRQKQLQYSEMQREKGRKRSEKMWEGHIATAKTTAINRLQPKDSSSSSSSDSKSKPIEEPNGSLSESPKPASDGNGKYPPCPQTEIVNLYHKTLPELPRVNHWPENLQVILRTRWKEDPVRQNLAWWEEFFRYVHESDFLMGRTKETFVADLEWLVRPKNFTKIANGRYHGRGGTASKPQPGIAAWLAERGNYAAAG
jgi:uncharacterized protein YdaU (DUF1376 family)